MGDLVTLNWGIEGGIWRNKLAKIVWLPEDTEYFVVQVIESGYKGRFDAQRLIPQPFIQAIKEAKEEM